MEKLCIFSAEIIMTIKFAVNLLQEWLIHETKGGDVDGGKYSQANSTANVNELRTLQIRSCKYIKF